MTQTQTNVVYQFNKEAILDWKVVDDVVMGGKSNGSFFVNESGNGVFSGLVSLENNGGFSSVRHALSEEIDLSEKTHITLRIKGDGNTYQFRMKENKSDRHSYKKEFNTTGEWQEINLAFDSFVPSFRGQDLDLPIFSGEHLTELTFLIGNKKAQSFKLELDRIKTY